MSSIPIEIGGLPIELDIKITVRQPTPSGDQVVDRLRRLCESIEAELKKG
jgi:hypothetical protein